DQARWREASDHEGGRRPRDRGCKRETAHQRDDCPPPARLTPDLSLARHSRQFTQLRSNPMANQITYGDASRQAILRGVNSLANAVKVTLGPRGRNVILGKAYGSPTITKDGVTVAKEIALKDALENMGAQMVKEVASRTSDAAGDGTTTATVLAQAIYREGAKNVTAGANPMAIKRGIDKA